MRGAKPQLVVLNGTLIAFPPAPDWLSDEAQAEWRRMQPFLEEKKVLTDIDLANLENYCVVQGRVRECEAQLHELQKASKNNLSKAAIDSRSKIWRMQNQAMTQAKQLAAELGLTPMARSRAVFRDLFEIDGEDDDPLAIK
jgi:P27 family predicted phage terminase small subunit